MKTFLAIIGFLGLAFLVWFFGFRRGLLLNLGSKGNADSNLPPQCDTNRFGYRKDGVKDSACGNVPCDPDKPGYDMDGFPDTNCGFGRTMNPQTRAQGERMSQQKIDITNEFNLAENIAKNINTQFYNSRISIAEKINYINRQLKANGITRMMAIQTGSTPPPEFKLCDCRAGQHQVVSFWEWAFAGGCGGLSVVGQPCFPA